MDEIELVDEGPETPQDVDVKILTTTRGTVIFHLRREGDEVFILEFPWKEAKKLGDSLKAAGKKAGKLLQ